MLTAHFQLGIILVLEISFSSISSFDQCAPGFNKLGLVAPGLSDFLSIHIKLNRIHYQLIRSRCLDACEVIDLCDPYACEVIEICAIRAHVRGYRFVRYM